MVGLVSAAPYIIIEKRTTISGNGTGNGTSDGNNYTTAISVSGTTTKTLNLARSGMVNLTASWEDLTGAGVETDPVFRGNTSLICWANGTNCLPDDAYNASYLTAETDPYYRGNASSICWSNGTNCLPDDAYNASYLTAEVDPYYNRTFNHSWVLALGYITDGNTGWDNSYSLITNLLETDQVFRGNTSLICWSNGTNCPGASVNNGGYSNVTRFTSTNESIIWTVTNSTDRDAVVNISWVKANCAYITGSSDLCDGNDASGGGGGFSANQSVNTSSAVTFSGINITATDAALQFNSSGLRWMIQVQDAGANLKFIDVQGSVLLALNKDSDTTTAKNLIGQASYAGAIPVSAQGAASQTANLFVAESSAGADYVIINGTGFLNSSVGTFIDAKNCDTVDTDASGRLACGTDASSGSSTQTFNISLQHSLSTDITNYANYSNNTINLAANKAAFIECNIFTNQTANTIATHYRIGHSGTSFYQDQGQHWTSATALANCAGTGSSGYTTCAAATAGHGTGVQTYNVYSGVVTGASGGKVWVEYKAEAAGTVMILKGSTCEVDIT